MMYVTSPVVQELERLKQMKNNKTNVWDVFLQNAQVGKELEINFGWLFKKRKL
jgi:hypothetical protein